MVKFKALTHFCLQKRKESEKGKNFEFKDCFDPVYVVQKADLSGRVLKVKVPITSMHVITVITSMHVITVITSMHVP